EAIQEGETRDAVKKRDDRRTLIEAFLVCPPRLQRATGNVQYRGCWTLREALGLQVAILGKQGSTFEARPALVAIMIAMVVGLAYRCHRPSPLPKPLPCEKWRAQDGEVAA